MINKESMLEDKIVTYFAICVAVTLSLIAKSRTTVMNFNQLLKVLFYPQISTRQRMT